MRYLPLLLLVCCSSPVPKTAEAPLAKPGSGSTATISVARLSSGSAVAEDCLSPLHFGAVINDGIDDRAAVQSTIDAACTLHRPVCLPTGDLHITRRYGTGEANAWSLAVTCDGVTIAGDGDSSKLVMLGSAQIPPMTGPGDWWLLKVSGNGHTLRDFAIVDTARVQPTSEQTHLIKLLGPTTNLVVQNMFLNLSDQGAGTGGDCIQAGGEAGAEVRGIVIDKVRGGTCDRSFIGLQRYVFDLSCTNCSSNLVGDQVLDEEPTGVGTIGGIRLTNPRFRRNGLGDGVAISIAGGAGGAAPGYDHIIDGGTIDGSILIYNSGHTTLRDVRIVSSGVAPTIDIKKSSSDVLLDHVYAEHNGQVAAQVVFMGLHTSGWPTNLEIRSSHLVQRTEGDVVRGEPVVGLTVATSMIECLGPVGNVYSAVAVRSLTSPVVSAGGVKLLGNTASGNCRYLLRASANGAVGIGAATVTANTISGAVYGVYYENGLPLVKPAIDGNIFFGIAAANQIIGTGTVGWVGSNSP